MTRDCLPLPQKKKAYARAGVDVDLANKLKRGIAVFVRQTHGPQVFGKIGGFGGLFRPSFPGCANRCSLQASMASARN